MSFVSYLELDWIAFSKLLCFNHIYIVSSSYSSPFLFFIYIMEKNVDNRGQWDRWAYDNFIFCLIGSLVDGNYVNMPVWIVDFVLVYEILHCLWLHFPAWEALE